MVQQDIYIPGDSFLYRLDPRLKIAALLWISLLSGFVGTTGLIMVTAGVFLICVFSRLPVRSYKAIAFVTGCLGLFYALGMGWEWSGYRIWQGHWSVAGVYEAVVLIWRVMLVFIVTRVVFAVTTPIELGLSIAGLLNPLAKISSKTSDLILLITLTLRFMPLLVKESALLWKARVVKGDLAGGTWRKWLEAIKLIQPLLLLSMRRAEELAENLLARGYQTGRYRIVPTMKWKQPDSVVSTLALVWSVVAIIMGL